MTHFIVMAFIWLGVIGIVSAIVVAFRNVNTATPQNMDDLLPAILFGLSMAMFILASVSSFVGNHLIPWIRSIL